MFFKAKIWLKVLLNVGGCGGQPLSSKSILRASEPADLQFWGTLFFDPSFFGLNQ